MGMRCRLDPYHVAGCSVLPRSTSLRAAWCSTAERHGPPCARVPDRGGRATVEGSDAGYSAPRPSSKASGAEAALRRPLGTSGHTWRGFVLGCSRRSFDPHDRGSGRDQHSRQPPQHPYRSRSRSLLTPRSDHYCLSRSALRSIRWLLQFVIVLLPGNDRRRRPGEHADQAVRGVHRRRLGPAVTRPGRPLPGGNDQPDPAGQPGRAAGHHATRCDIRALRPRGCAVALNVIAAITVLAPPCVLFTALRPLNARGARLAQASLGRPARVRGGGQRGQQRRRGGKGLRNRQPLRARMHRFVATARRLYL